MIRLFKAASIFGALAAVAVFASPAPAAKGIKKTHEHHFNGTVVSVNAVKGQKGQHHATLTIHVTHHKHKKGQPAVAKGANHTFTVNVHTHVSAVSHHHRHHVGVGALRPGEHVTVFAHHHHADKVVIHHLKKKKIA